MICNIKSWFGITREITDVGLKSIIENGYALLVAFSWTETWSTMVCTLIRLLIYDQCMDCLPFSQQCLKYSQIVRIRTLLRCPNIFMVFGNF